MRFIVASQLIELSFEPGNSYSDLLEWRYGIHKVPVKIVDFFIEPKAVPYLLIDF